MQRLRERDIDLLICSELHGGGGPLHKLFMGAWNDGNGEFGGAWVSHWEDDGETDIVALFTSATGDLWLLIENKIDAEFQPDQPERYRARAERWKTLMSLEDEVETVLFAPDGYLENEGSEIFDRQVSYDEVVAALAESSDNRTLFLARTLQSGIRSHRQAYQPLHSDSTTELWNAIWEMANTKTPQLRMKKPGSKPADAGFIHLVAAVGVTTAETRGRARIVYKPRRSRADLQFSGLPKSTLVNAVDGILNEDMEVALTERSAIIRIQVPAVDFSNAPERQEDAIRQGLEAAERLRQFFIENRLLELVPSA